MTGGGLRGSRLRGNDGANRCEVPACAGTTGPTDARFPPARERRSRQPPAHAGGGMCRSRGDGNLVWERTQGCEVPACAGTTGQPMRGSRLRGNDEVVSLPHTRGGCVVPVETGTSCGSVRRAARFPPARERRSRQPPTHAGGGCVVPVETGTSCGSVRRAARFPPARERRGNRCEVPACAGTTKSSASRTRGGGCVVPVETGTSCGSVRRAARFPPARERRGQPMRGSRLRGNDGATDARFPPARERRRIV